MRKVTSAVFPDTVNTGPHARKVILPKPLILPQDYKKNNYIYTRTEF